MNMTPAIGLVVRRDGPLAAALIFAALVVFQDSVRAALAFARQVEVGYGLELLPGLFLLLAMFGFHQYGKHQEARRVAAAAAAESQQLRDRARELEQVSRCGQRLAQALSVDALRIAVYRHVPDLLGETDVWLVGACEGQWEVLADTRPEAAKWWESHLTDIVQASERDSRTPSLCDTCWCYPLVAHERLVGVLGVDTRGVCLSTHMERVCDTLGALLAIAIRNVQLFAETRTESTRDPLTGCLRRAPALELLRAELRRSRRTGDPVSLILLDLDGFKAINDSRGHACGDQVLAQVGRVLRRDLRSSDTKCRYGGDEFLLVLPETSAAGVRHVAETVRLSISELEVSWGGETLRLTASVGVATGGEQEVAAEDLVARADLALYAAKRGGRNCVRRETGAGDPLPQARPRTVEDEIIYLPAADAREPVDREPMLTPSMA